MNSHKSLFYDYIHQILGRVIGVGVMQFVVLVLVARILGTQSYGTYVLFVSVSMIMTALTLWTSASIVRFGREEWMQDGTIRKTMSANFWVVLCCFALAILVILVVKTKLLEYVNLPEHYVYLMLVYVGLVTISANIPIAMQAIGRMGLFAYMPLLWNGAYLIGLGIVVATGMVVSSVLVINCLLAANVVSVIVGLVLLRHELDLTPSWVWIKKCLSYSWPLSFGGVSQQVIDNVGQIVTGLVMSAAYVGLFNVAYQLYGFVLTIPMLSVNLAFPLMVSLMVGKRHNEIASYIKYHVPVIVLAWSLIIVVVMAVTPEVVRIFGKGYELVSEPMLILLGGVSFRIFTIIESPIVSAYGLIKQSVAVSIGIGVVNLVLAWVLIPVMGINGAALATSLAFLGGVVSHSWIVKHWLKLNDFRNYIWCLPAVVAISLWFVDGFWERWLIAGGIVSVSIAWTIKVRLFDGESWAFIEGVAMPLMFKRFLRLVYVRRDNE